MPFTTDEFFSVFARYNEAIWPSQVLAYVFAALAVWALARLTRWRTKVLTAILAVMWAVNGIGYHWIFFTEVNPAAWAFGLAFVVQALALAGSAYMSPGFSFEVRQDERSFVGLALMAFATIVYPIWGWQAGHSYPATPMFGVAPCPTTIFTVGLLLLGTWNVTRWLLIMPALWSALGGSAAILLRVPQDYGLIATLVVVAAVAIGQMPARQVCRNLSSRDLPPGASSSRNTSQHSAQ